MVNVFAVPIFFICFREAIETSIIVSVLLSFLKQTLGRDRDAANYRKLVRQIWWGTGLGLSLCIVIGAAFIGIFYSMGKDHWAGTENLWEGAFGLFATLIITWMGAALLRVSKLQDKWRVKLAKAMESKKSTRGGCWSLFKLWGEKYAMFTLPFVTVVREGLEAVVFIGGISVSLPATAFPLPVVTGLLCGCLIGFFIYKGGNAASLQTFLIVSTCFLYLVAAGLFSKAVWLFEADHWNKVIGADSSESGSGPGSYDIRKSVWHVNCCNPKLNGGGGWGIFNGILGWQNSATYGSVLSYDLYWLVVILGFLAMRYNERKGHWPLMKSKAAEETNQIENQSRGSSIAYTDKEAEEGKVLTQEHSVAR